MNIYFTGSHGTGKTTTAKLVAKKAKMCAPPSVSRSSPYKQGSLEHQGYVMDKVYQRAMEHSKSVHDRTPLDVYAYTLMMEHKGEYDHQLMKAQRFMRVLQDTGEPLFYFPITFPLVSDGVRPGKFEQIEIDTLIKPMLKWSDVNLHVVPDGTPEERTDFVMERI